MKDELMRDALQGAYKTPPPTDAAMNRMNGRTQSLVAQATKRKNVGRIGLLATCVTMVGFYPPTTANLFCLELASRLRSQPGYEVTLSSTGLSHGTASPPTTMYVQGNRAVTRAQDGSILTFDGSVVRAYDRSAETSWTTQNPQLDLFGSLMDRLNKLDLSKRLTRLGTRQVNGHPVERVEVNLRALAASASDKNTTLRMDLDPIQHLPLHIEVPFLDGTLNLDYDYHQDKVQEGLAMLNPTGYRKISYDHPDTGSFHPLKRMKLGRDTLTLYRIEQNPEGTIFVLYTLKGYHGAADRTGNYLRLRGASGVDWLTLPIDYQFSHLRLDGENPKAQVFFAPSPGKPLQSCSLHLRLVDGWEIATQTCQPGGFKGDHFHLDQGMTGGKETAVLTGSPVAIADAPDWFYLNGNHELFATLRLQSTFQRMIYAAGNGDDRNAERFAKELLAASPPSGFFGPKGNTLGILYLAELHQRDLAGARETYPRLKSLGYESFTYPVQDSAWVKALSAPEGPRR